MNSDWKFNSKPIVLSPSDTLDKIKARILRKLQKQVAKEEKLSRDWLLTKLIEDKK